MYILKFNFDKPWYRQSELLDKLSMSNACLKRYMKEQLEGGGTLADMGHLKFEGFKEACWCATKFCNWLIENKLEKEQKYDYEIAEQKKVRMNVVNLNKQYERKKQYE